jgi:hypothetical protein
MSRSTLTRPIAAALLAAAVAAPAAPATGDGDGGVALRRDGSKAVPFVRDPDPAAREDGFGWDEAGIGAGAAVAALLLTSAGARIVRGRRRPAPARSA